MSVFNATAGLPLIDAKIKSLAYHPRLQDPVDNQLSGQLRNQLHANMGEELDIKFDTLRRTVSSVEII